MIVNKFGKSEIQTPIIDFDSSDFDLKSIPKRTEDVNKAKVIILQIMNKRTYLHTFKNRDDYYALMGVAERYGAMTIPDKQAAAELNKEYNPIKTNVTIPVSKIFSANEWSNILQGKTSDEEIGYQITNFSPL